MVAVSSSDRISAGTFHFCTLSTNSSAESTDSTKTVFSELPQLEQTMLPVDVRDPKNRSHSLHRKTKNPGFIQPSQKVKSDPPMEELPPTGGPPLPRLLVNDPLTLPTSLLPRLSDSGRIRAAVAHP